jgi:hypothetical protein
MTFVTAKVIPPELRRLLLPGKRPRDPHLQRVHAISRHHPVGYREDGRLSSGEVGDQLVGASNEKAPKSFDILTFCREWALAALLSCLGSVPA